MVHSGSRNLGFKVANHYEDLAKNLNEKYYSSVNPKWDLAFLPVDTQEAHLYINEMNYCGEFALANRKLMLDAAKEVTTNVLGEHGFTVEFEEMINIAHNYARQENHFGSNVWVHRKGATSARKDEIGIIPGSMGTKSYIVKGRGNKESFESCSHGAGRKMSRTVAKNTLDLASQIKIMDDKGIVHGIRNKADLDEAPGSYKDIDVVMENQKDLVEPIVELLPLAVLKG